ncbi:MAG: hypothetical protein AB1452_08960, partial [Pseudomonadota bacterium]
MDKTTNLERIGADELVRLEAERRARAQAEEEERAALERAWRGEEEYARAVAELREERAPRRAPAIAGAILLAAGIALAVVYSYRTQQDRMAAAAEVEALRLAAESL